jgi:hypothetical protein
VENYFDWALIPSDWVFLEHVQAVLKPFYDYTLLASQSQPQLSSGLGVYMEISELFDNILSSDDFALYETCILDAIRIGKNTYH